MLQDTTLATFVSDLASRSPLDHEDRAALLALPYIVRDFGRNRVVVREGEKTGHCHVLLDGWAYSARMTRDGSRAILGVHMKGDLLDATGSCGDGSCEVQALGTITVASIPCEALTQLAMSRPAISRAFWILAARNASVVAEWLLSVARRDARGRMSHLFCEIAARREAEGADLRRGFLLPLTQEHIADCLGLTPVHVNRVLQTLRRDGLVESGSGHIKITRWAELAAEGDFDPDYLRLPAREQRLAA